MKRLFVTTGLVLGLADKAVVAYKTIDKEITLRNVNDVCIHRFDICLHTNIMTFTGSVFHSVRHDSLEW